MSWIARCEDSDPSADRGRQGAPPMPPVGRTCGEISRAAGILSCCTCNVPMTGFGIWKRTTTDRFPGTTYCSRSRWRWVRRAVSGRGARLRARSARGGGGAGAEADADACADAFDGAGSAGGRKRSCGRTSRGLSPPVLRLPLQGVPFRLLPSPHLFAAAVSKSLTGRTCEGSMTLGITFGPIPDMP